MRYKVSVVLSEAIEAEDVEEAMEEFLTRFEFADVKNGTWRIEPDKGGEECLTN